MNASASQDTCMTSDANQTAAQLLRRPATTSYDAIGLLYGASRHGEERTAMEISSYNKNCPILDVGLEAWSNFQFVGTGLLSAQEAISLMDYFFDFLLPFTPIVSSAYRNYSTHKTLLKEEPILVVTILMIASRFMQLSGPAAVARSYAVHNTLWEHLQGMINHMIWGQECFYGIFCGAMGSSGGEAEYTSDSAHRMCPPLGGLRTLGTCEALILLTEWNPRAIHFPPREDGHAVVPVKKRSRISSTSGRSQLEYFDPAWRSDRLSWSMLGNAFTLAVELGLYDESDPKTLGTRKARVEIWNNASYRERASNVHHILLVYLAQTSARLGPYQLSFINACFIRAN